MNPATSPATKPPSQVLLPRAFRVRWLVGFVTALIAPGVLTLIWVWDQPWLALSLPVILYGLIPLLDLACGRDGFNLSPEQEQRAGRDPFFKALLYLTVPIHAASIYAVLITAGLWINAWASEPSSAGYGGPLATLVLVAGAALYSPESFGIGTPDDIHLRALIELSIGAAIGAITLKLGRAFDAHPGCRTLLVGGGVSANSRLRGDLGAFCEQRGIALRLAEMACCVDNGAMIAGLGCRLLEAGETADLSLAPVPTTAC